MEVWIITYFDRVDDATDVESVWGSKEKAVNYLKSCGAKDIQNEWWWSFTNDQYDTFDLFLVREITDEPGWLSPVYP